MALEPSTQNASLPGEHWQVHAGESPLVSFTFALNWLPKEVRKKISSPLIHLAVNYTAIEAQREFEQDSEHYHVHGLVSAFEMTYMLSEYGEEIDFILKQGGGEGLTAGVFYECIAGAMLHDLGGNMKPGEKEAGAQSELLKSVVMQNCLHAGDANEDAAMTYAEAEQHLSAIQELHHYTGYHEGVNPSWYGLGDGRWFYEKEIPLPGKLMMISDWAQMAAYNYTDQVAEAFLEGDRDAYRFKTGLGILFIKALKDVASMLYYARNVMEVGPVIMPIRGIDLIPPVMRNRFTKLATNFVWYDLADMARSAYDMERRLTPDEFVFLAMNELGLGLQEVLAAAENQDEENLPQIAIADR